MFRLGILLLLVFCLQASSAVELATKHPNRYVVQPGDTLWQIASKFLKNPWEWPKIWQRNPGVENPNYIYPGDVLMLAMVNGQPRIVLAKTAKPGPDNNNTIKLSPHMRQEPDSQAIFTIPLSAIQPFLSQSRMVSNEEYSNAPYIVALPEFDRIFAGGTGEEVYVLHVPKPEPTTYGVYHKQSAYVDPVTKKVLGYHAQYLAKVELKDYGDTSIFTIITNHQEVQAGDRLLTPDPILPPYFLPKSAPPNLTGYIIDVEGSIFEIGQFAIVALNLGSKQGIAPGDVFDIMQPGKKVSDILSADQAQVKLPDRKVGVLMVFKTSPTVSFALVMSATDTISVGYQVRTPR